ncbi:MAG: hypothetical protein ABSG84_09045 [Acidobacteriaceae bacterium]|jgi:hypothetical protein
MSDPAIPLPSPIFTREQAVLISSRLFVAYLLFWVASDLISLPNEVLTLKHELLGLSPFTASYYARSYVLSFAANILRIALWLMGAGWFYRCGPRIYRFFNPEESTHL